MIAEEEVGALSWKSAESTKPYKIRNAHDIFEDGLTFKGIIIQIKL